MDLGGNDNFQQEKRNEDLMSLHSPNVPSDWRFGGSNLENALMGTIPAGYPISVCKGDLMESSSCSSASLMDSLCPPVWDHPTNTQNLNFSDINLQSRASSTSNPLGIRKGTLGHLSIDSIERTPEMGWNPPISMVKGGMVLPTGPGMLPQSVSQLQADSGFIERAARFSFFAGRDFGDMMNHFSIPEPITHARGALLMQQPQGLFAGNKLKSVSGGQSHRNEVNMAEASKDVSMAVELGTTGGSPLKNKRKRESLLQLHDEARQGVGVSGNESDEAECSGSGHGGGQEEPSLLEDTGREPSFSNAFGLKKRKRSQDTEPDRVKEVSQTPGETTKDGIEIQHKGDQTPTSTTNKPCGKHSKQGSQDLDSPKGEYVHVRARRGQATNSHSLAERVRRERISERMKLLQDLVPGCSKVTGKAVMLDEIINYVQSLQRQVEFLSMKLATVYPRLDFNLEGLLARDILQPRPGPSSTLGYSSDMTTSFPSLHPSQPGSIQSGFPGLSSSSDGFERSINSQLAAMRGGYKEPCQVPNVWREGELHNVIQLLNSSAPLDCQNLNGSLPPGQMKVEL